MFRYGGTFAIANIVKVVHLNEEKNHGGAGNLYNKNLYVNKWKRHLPKGLSTILEI